jgi:DNA polymerase-3 subunit beta
MKISIARSEFLEALSVVSRGLTSRTTLPILSGIHFSAKDGEITLQATDLEVSVKTTAKARVDTPGQAVIPGKLLSEIVRNLPEAAVDLDATGTGSASVACGQASFSLRTLSPEDFPKFPEVQPGESVEIPTALFRSIVHQVSRSASRDETRPILTGVLLVVEHGSVKMVATDSYRLCVRDVVSEGVSGTMEAVVPGKALEDVAKLAGDSAAVSVGVSENQIVFTFGGTTFISRRIEGSFPNYKQLIPAEHTTRVEVDRAELHSAAKRVSLMVQHGAPLRITVNVADHTLRLSAATQDVGEATEDIEVSPTGEDVEIAFNHAYLLDGVSVIESERVALETTSPLKPGVLKPVGDEGLVYLLMPVRLG